MSNFIFPKPRDRETLEDMASDIFSLEFGNVNLQRYGRNGQSQDGVDVAGIVNGRIVGIQCKNHPDKDISITEINKEIKKSEKFKPNLSRFIIFTSAKRDKKVLSHVLKISKDRTRKKIYPVEIKFWEEIEDLLLKYPDLAFKYYVSQLPAQKPEEIILSCINNRNLTTFSFPDQEKQIIKALEDSLLVKRVDPYIASIGISSFPGTSLDGLIDIELQLAHLFSNQKNSLSIFNETVSSLKNLKRFLDNKFFSKDIILFIQTRLTIAFLIGHFFKKVTKYNLTLVSGNQVWRTNNLPFINPCVRDSLPEINPDGIKEAVVMLNIGRDISKSVTNFVKSWDQPPYALLGYFVEGGMIRNAAHALAVSQVMAQKLKNLKDKWGMNRIHFFGAIPAPLATLIAYHLNSMCPINIYFMDQANSRYVLGGEITNNL